MVSLKVSVVVPVYNAQETIGECIESLLKIDYQKELLEIIFVDDGSTDGTREIIERYDGIKLIRQEHGGPAAARNLGIKESTGEVVVFTDSDCIVETDWVKMLLQDLEDHDGVGGSLVPASMDTLAERFEQNRRDRLYGLQKRIVETLPSCNLAFKRKVLDEIGGFDEDFKRASAEDYELCKRIADNGHMILYNPQIQVLHKHSQTLSGIFRRAYYHGREIMLFRRKTGGNPIWELIRVVAKAPLIPFHTIMRYPIEMMPLGLAYESLSFFGNIRGYILYFIGI
jgi:glycosyltransferase involved in cell wall biosynthesis